MPLLYASPVRSHAPPDGTSEENTHMLHEKNKIRYTYVAPDDLKPVEVHGVWGGTNDRGELEATIYTEFEAVPEESVQYITEDGSLTQEIPSDAPMHVKRYVHAKMLMSYSAAKSIYEWMGMQLAALEDEMDGGDMPEQPEADEVPQ
jgi:hypothetical protein